MKPSRFVLLQPPKIYWFSILVENRKIFAVWLKLYHIVTHWQNKYGGRLLSGSSQLCMKKKILTFNRKTNLLYKSQIGKRHITSILYIMKGKISIKVVWAFGFPFNVVTNIDVWPLYIPPKESNLKSMPGFPIRGWCKVRLCQILSL